jgi:hypothetical protein
MSLYQVLLRAVQEAAVPGDGIRSLLNISTDCPFIYQVLLRAVQEASGPGGGDGIRFLPFKYKIDLKIS